jgi:hypothetical protein
MDMFGELHFKNLKNPYSRHLVKETLCFSFFKYAITTPSASTELKDNTLRKIYAAPNRLIYMVSL